jgi:periplasmic protein TonB
MTSSTAETQYGSVAGSRSWTQRILIGAVLVLVAGAVVWGGMNLSRSANSPKQQIARIMVLPDTPPPPPPPEEKKPPPKEERVNREINTPKPQPTPEPQQLKMEGQTGEGPSAFASGEVKQEYIGGDIGNGARYAAYIGRVEQRIQAELTRHHVQASSVKLFLWLKPDGSIQRYTVEGGDPDTEKSVRLALADLSRLDESPDADMPMPIGLRVN